jgi:hypothetical protein
MKPLRASWRWWVAAGSVALVLAGCALASYTVAQAGMRQRYDDARSRWQAQAPAHYRLAVTSGPDCRIDLEVQAERVVRILHQDSCLHPARSVSDLFALIERGQVAEPCFFAGCACRIDVTTYASYDPTYGYPLDIRLRYNRAANWWTQGFWGYVVSRGHTPGCAKTAESEVAQVALFTPLDR